jgi:hypothetical protein
LILASRRNYNQAMAPTAADPDRTQALMVSLRDFLRRAKASLDDEIHSYPTPIPRCDAQFNHAYEQRARLAALLQRIDTVANEAAGANEHMKAMAEFSALPPIGEAAEERELRARVADALARAGAQVDPSSDRRRVDLTAGGH